ncbi:transcription termination/antitermination NusG family protein [Roseburia hominis]
MWYLLHCPPKSEEMVLQKYKESVDGKVLSNAFIFTYDRMRRYLGDWHHEKNNLFPGYIFLESDEIQSIQEARECYLRMTEEEWDAAGSLRVVLPEEQKFLKTFCGRQHHVAMSKGVIRSGETLVTEGPLTGRENLITRIDRHKRTAFLKTPMLAGKGPVQVGLEITEKIE